MTTFSLNANPKPTTQIFEKTCLCGKRFRVKPCHFNDPKKKYCSNPCRSRYFVNPVKAVIKQMKCSYCQKDFEMTLGQFNQKFIDRFCSRECSYKGKLKGKYKKCLNCDKEFYSQRSREKKCCSKRCDAILHPRKGFMTNVNNSGKNNGQYSHGKYVGRGRAGGDTHKKKVREMVIERDGGKWCLLCGKPGPGLHLHRVIYGSQCGVYELDNCMQLCAEDHEKIHSNKHFWQPILLEYLKDNSKRLWLNETA
jgi:hypothetical protein